MMKTLRLVLLALPLAALLGAAIGLGQSVPQQINYQGRLDGAGGIPVTGQVDMVFSFYTGPGSQATRLLSVTQSQVAVTGGLYHLLIGSGQVTTGMENSLAGVFENHAVVWMGVKVGPDPEMVPRVPVSSVPYSFQAGKVDGRWLDKYLAAADYDHDGFVKTLYGGTDCDDTNAAVYPGAPELCDGIDNQCPGDRGYGLVDEGCIQGSTTDRILRQTVDDMMFGNDDFAALSAQLQQVIAQDPNNHNAVFFKAVADFLQTQKEHVMGEGATCDFKDLYTRAGYYNVAGDTAGFWSVNLQPQIVPFTCRTQGNCTATGCQLLTDAKDGHHYLSCLNAWDTWYDARSFCQSQGGDLVAINNSAEENFIDAQLISGGSWTTLPWIGLTRPDPGRWWDFRWSNGDDLNHDNWAWMYGYPDPYPGDSCGLIVPYFDFQWANLECHNNSPFICEEQIDRSEGDVKDSFPAADEWRAYLNNCLIPDLETFRANLNNSPPDLEYALMAVDAGGPFFDHNHADDTDYFWVDAGDASMLRAAVSAGLAGLKIADAYNWDNVLLNDFDGGLGNTVDPLGLIKTKYVNLARLQKMARLAQARADVVTALQDYHQASAWIMNESGIEQENGLLTLGRHSELYGTTVNPDDPDGFAFSRLWEGFDNETQQSRFIADESYFRSWAQGIVDAFTVNVDHPFDQRPGGLVDPNRQAVVNFYKFWAGIDFRDTYLKTITDPMSNQTVLGVTNYNQLNDPAMLTFLQVLKQWNGVAPVPGDLQYDHDYQVRINSPMASTKMIDGATDDWSGANSNLVSQQPLAALDEFPRPQLGDISVAKDDYYLYLLWTQNMMDFERATLTVFSSTPGNEVQLDWDWWRDYYWPGWGMWTYYPFESPWWGFGAGVTEVAIPLSNFGPDEWVKIKLEEQPFFSGTFTRENMIVKIKPGVPPDANINCGQSLTSTTAGQGDEISGYSCVGWNETGPDLIYQVVTTTTANLSASLSNLGADLDVFILSDSGGQAKPDHCLEYGDVSCTLRDAPPGTYFVVVDGYNGNAGAFTLTVHCDGH